MQMWHGVSARAGPMGSSRAHHPEHSGLAHGAQVRAPEPQVYAVAVHLVVAAQHSHLPTTDHADGSCRRIMPTGHADGSCRRGMPTGHADGESRRGMPTDNADGACRRGMPMGKANDRTCRRRSKPLDRSPPGQAAAVRPSRRSGRAGGREQEARLVLWCELREADAARVGVGRGCIAFAGSARKVFDGRDHLDLLLRQGVLQALCKKASQLHYRTALTSATVRHARLALPRRAQACRTLLDAWWSAACSRVACVARCTLRTAPAPSCGGC